MKLTELEFAVLQRIARNENLSTMFAGNTRPVSQAIRRLEKKGALVPTQAGGGTGGLTEAGKLYLTGAHLAGKDPAPKS